MNPDDRLRHAAESVVAHLQSEIERQIRDLAGGWRATAEEQRSALERDLETARAGVTRLEGEVAALRRESADAAEAAIEMLRAEAARELAAAIAREREHAARTAEEAVAAARATAARELEETLARVRADAARELDEALARTREEGARELQAALARLRSETEADTARLRQQAADQLSQLRAEADAERAALLAHAGTERSRLQDELAAAVVGAATAERTAEDREAIARRLLEGVRALDAAGSLTDTLGALADAASVEAGRAIVFVLQEGNIRVWRATGFPDAGELRGRLSPIAGSGLVAEAIASQEAQMLRAGETGRLPGPSFLTLPEGRLALAVPVLLTGDVVAVVYADDVVEDGTQRPATWPSSVEVLARYGGRALEILTAFRTSQLLAAGNTRAPGVPVSTAVSQEEHESARRYARLLISEIKLYNEAAVREGRTHGDLLERLRPEIDRARQVYEDRVPGDVRAARDYFDEELLQTLAGGNPAALGKTVV